MKQWEAAIVPFLVYSALVSKRRVLISVVVQFLYIYGFFIQFIYIYMFSFMNGVIWSWYHETQPIKRHQGISHREPRSKVVHATHVHCQSATCIHTIRLKTLLRSYTMHNCPVLVAHACSPMCTHNINIANTSMHTWDTGCMPTFVHRMFMPTLSTSPVGHPRHLIYYSQG